MKPESKLTASQAALRRQVEEHLSNRPQISNENVEAETSQMQLIQQLQTRTIELEIQNEELRKSRTEAEEATARVMELYDFAPNPYLSLGRDSAILKSNLAAARLLSRGGASLQGKLFWLFVAESDRVTFRSFLQRVFDGMPEADCDVKLTPSDDSQALVRINAALSRDKQECRAMISNFIERPMIEDDNHRYLQILDESLNEIYIFDSESLMFVRVNSAARRKLGYTMEELNQLTPLDLKPEFNIELFAALLEPLRCGQAEQIVFETVHRCKDGSTYPVEVHLQLLRGRGRTCFVAIILDITERKQSEASLHASEQKYRAIVDHADVGVTMVDLTTRRFVTVNQKLCDLFGYTDDELLSKTLPEVIHPEDVPMCFHFIDRLLSRESAQFTSDLRYVRQDGSGSWCNLTGSILWNSEMHRQCCIGIVKDIADQKHAEQNKQVHFLKLAQVGRIAVAGEMASGIAHELNQPLTAIVNFADACREGMKVHTVDTDRQLKLITKVMDEAHRAGEIIRRLRNLVKNSKPQRCWVNLRELIEQVLPFVENERYLNGIQLKYHYPDGMPNVIGDLILLQQALLNLIRNAIEAQHAQMDAPKQVTVEVVSKAKDAVEIVVSDNGSAEGITDLEKMFEQFFTTKLNGIGLGLSISRSIAEAHQGTLTVRRQTTRGLAFHLFLPVRGGRQ